MGHLPALDITATDHNPLYLRRARDAFYPLSSLKEVPEILRATCFQAESAGKRYRVNPALRDGILWLTHDFFSGPPGYDFQLIFIRNNLLTYYTDERIGPVLAEIIESLAACGYLVIGSHEKFPFQPSGLHPCRSLSYVFKKGG
jgi:chemotaxis methyl-accepting protein methylase